MIYAKLGAGTGGQNAMMIFSQSTAILSPPARIRPRASGAILSDSAVGPPTLIAMILMI